MIIFIEKAANGLYFVGYKTLHDEICHSTNDSFETPVRALEAAYNVATGALCFCSNVKIYGHTSLLPSQIIEYCLDEINDKQIASYGKAK